MTTQADSVDPIATAVEELRRSLNSSARWVAGLSEDPVTKRAAAC